MKRGSCLPEIRADGGEGAVLHAEAFRNRAELREAEAFVEVPGVDVPLDDGVELENPETMGLGLCEAVEDELLAEMPSATIGTYGVACVCDVAAAANVVWMEDVQAENRPVVISRNARMRLRREELRPRLARQRFLLWEGVARIDHLVSDGDHRVKIAVLAGRQIYDYFHVDILSKLRSYGLNGDVNGL